MCRFHAKYNLDFNKIRPSCWKNRKRPRLFLRKGFIKEILESDTITCNCTVAVMTVESDIYWRQRQSSILDTF